MDDKNKGNKMDYTLHVLIIQIASSFDNSRK